MLLASRTASRGARLCFLERLLIYHFTRLDRHTLSRGHQFFRTTPILSESAHQAGYTYESITLNLNGSHLGYISHARATSSHQIYIYRSIASPTLSLCLSLPLLSIVTLTLRFSLDILYKRHAALRARVAPHPRRDHTIGGRLSRRHQKAFTMPEAEEGIST